MGLDILECLLKGSFGSIARECFENGIGIGFADLGYRGIDGIGTACEKGNGKVAVGW